MDEVNMFLKHMNEYQKKNNIVAKCIANSMLLRKYLLSNNHYAKLKAVFAVYDNKDLKKSVLSCHMVVEVNDEGNIIDPSYEVNQHDVQYMDKIPELVKYLKRLKESCTVIMDGLSIQQAIVNFVEFLKNADDVNNNGKKLSDGKALTYLRAQEEYVIKNIISYSSKSSPSTDSESQ